MPKKEKTPPIERIRSGIDGLDELIEGGFVKDSTVMVRGDTGTAKTILCLQYLYMGATKYNEPGVYLSFSESEKTLSQHGLGFGWDMDKLVNENKLALIRYEPHEIADVMEIGGGFLRDTIESLGARRLVIDSLTAYEMPFENTYKASESVLAIFELLRKWDTTTLVTSEVRVTPRHESGGELGHLTDGIINLYHIRDNSHRRRALEIIKMRDTAHDEEMNLFTIEKAGLKVKGRMKHI